MVNEHRRTVNIHVGRKLSGKSRDEILEEIVKKFEGLRIMAVQQFPDNVRVTFNSEDVAIKVLNSSGVRLFDMWCRMDGGPPSTMVHLFDYPYEEDTVPIDALFKTYGKVKGIRLQKYITREDIFTGTRLIDIVIERTPPRLVSINGHICRVWYKGQPIICNSCGAQGHKANECPDKDKCHRCGESGHLARHCTNAWGTRSAPAGPSSGADPSDGADGDANQDPPAQGASASEAGVRPRSSSSGPPAQGASASEASVVSGPPSDPSAQGASASETDVDPESRPSALADSLGIDDSPEPVIGEFSTSQLSSPSISDFSDESQSILKPVNANNDRETNIDNESNESENINSSEFINESTNVEGSISSIESENMNESINLSSNLTETSAQISGDPKPPMRSGKGSVSKLSVASLPSKIDKPLSKKSLPKSGGPVSRTSKECPKNVGGIEESAMDISGGNRKRKSSDDKDFAEPGPPRPQRPGRSVIRTADPGRHSGLPTVSPSRPRRV